MKDIALKHGWEDLGPQKMKGLISFRKGDLRMNIYTTTKTVTFQNTHRQYDSGWSVRDVDESQLEQLLS